MAQAVPAEYIEKQIVKIDGRIEKTASLLDRLHVERQVLAKLIAAAEDVPNGSSRAGHIVPVRLTDAVRQYLAENGPATPREIVDALRDRVHRKAQEVSRSLLSTLSSLQPHGRLVQH